MLSLRERVLRTCLDRHVELTADVWMPDHIHMLLHGSSEDADFRRTLTVVRQRTAVRYRELTGKPLWQDGYYEHTLREGEDVLGVIEYTVLNPVRRGLVDDPADYPFCFVAAEYQEYFFGTNGRAAKAARGEARPAQP